MVKLKPGEMTAAPVKSEHGWHIIKLEDVRETKFPELAEIKGQVKQHLEQQKMLAFRDEIRKKAKTDYQFSAN
jgi:peptidyl-prolyl cis-trans isomerase C